MSGKYSRTYSRKKAPPAPPISQFDRLVSEHGKDAHHPIAAKTAGHVGKWGVTSFTSLRSIKENYGKEETGKRSRLDSHATTNKLIADTADEALEVSQNVYQPKRRKFFKSRDYDGSVSNSVTASSTSSVANPLSESQNSLPGLRETRAGSLKNEGSNKLKNLSNTSTAEKHGGGGIKLKIFKSRNRDLNSCDTYSSSVQLPSDDSGHSGSNTSSIANSPKSDLSQSEISNINCPSPNGLTLPNSQLHKESEKIHKEKKILKPSDPTSSHLHKDDKKLPQPSPVIAENVQDIVAGDNSYKTDVNTDIERTTSHSDNSYNGSGVRTIDSINEDKNLSCEKSQESKISNSEEKENLSLFSSGFDEEEIIDRTSIEYPSSSSSSAIPNYIDFEGVDSPHSTSSTTTLDTKPNPDTPKSTPPEYEPNISTLNKKKSIFKSRQKEGDTKKRATYKHKWHGNEDKEDSPQKSQLQKSSSQPDPQTSVDPFDFDTMHLTRVQTWPNSQPGMDCSLLEEQPVTKVKCPRQVKKYYTVIKNVKKTHQLQESGEFQEFNDDVDYFLDALRSSNSVSTRCLASLNLAQKCMTPAFRMHLRAHGTVIKFFKALADAPSHPQLAECAAMVMFALSQDRLNMDLDRHSLELMLNLLDTDSNVSDLGVTLADHSAKIRSLCEELQQKGHANHLRLDKINAATLAMETLLSLTSKRAGEWFKEELRDLGGVDHLVRTVSSCCTLFKPDFQSWTTSLLDKLSKVDRCLKVLENVTLHNEANQEYLLNGKGSELSSLLMRLFRMCRTEVPLHPENPGQDPSICNHNSVAAKGIVTTLITTIKVLINLTHGTRKEALGSCILGNTDEIYDLSLYCLLMMPIYLNHDTKFEMQVLTCCLLLNLVEYSPDNRNRVMGLNSPASEEVDNEDNMFKNIVPESAISSLMTLFYSSEESAREQEAHTDQIIDTDLVQEKQDSKEDDKKDEDIEETVTRLLQKAGRHMEDTLIAAYTALIAGFCLLDNKEFEEKIRLLQPEGHFKTMVAVLKKFLHFMKMTATTSLLRRMKPTERVVKYMEELDRSPEEEAEEARKKIEKEEAAQAMAFDAFGF